MHSRAHPLLSKPAVQPCSLAPEVPLLGNSSLGECEEFKKKIPDEMMSAHGYELFDFLADHVTSSGGCGGMVR